MRYRGGVGWVRRQGRKEDRRRKPQLNRRAAPKASSLSRNRRSSSKLRLIGQSKTQVGDRPESRAGDATAGVGRTIRQAGPEGISAAQAEGKPEGSAEGIGGR